jgi:hypothetical protein
MKVFSNFCKMKNLIVIVSTNTYFIKNVRWYVPCSVKYPRWSSFFRILSTNLWLVLIISIVTAVISTTLVGRYSCTSEWQVYKTLTSLLTNVCGVMLRVAVSTMPRSPSQSLLFLARVFLCGQSTVVQASPHGSLLTARTKLQFKAWMNSSPQVLNLPIHDEIISFSRMVTKRKYQECKNIF